MTTVDMSMLALLFGALLFAGVRHLIELGPESITPDAMAYVYKPRVISRAAPMDRRPDGNASLKAEIAQTPPGRHRAPELKPIKAHPDWPWSTQEFELRWDAFFDGLPDDAHVIKEWAGTGRA